MAGSVSLPDTEMPVDTLISAADAHPERIEEDAPAAIRTQSEREADQSARLQNETEEAVTTGATERPEETKPAADSLTTDAGKKNVQKDDYEEYRRSLPPTVAALLVEGKESPAIGAGAGLRSDE